MPQMTEAVATGDQVTYVTQSRFFTPAFNAAIFDGPIRIYFAQYQEAQALKLYFNLQERFGEVRKQARGLFKERGANIFVMIYPDEDSFGESFEQAGASVNANGSQIMKSKLGTDFIVGVRGPLEDDDLESLCREMDLIVGTQASDRIGASV